MQMSLFYMYTEPSQRNMKTVVPQIPQNGPLVQFFHAGKKWFDDMIIVVMYAI